MAIDTTSKALDVATQISNLSTALMAAVRGFTDIAQYGDNADIEFAGMSFEGTALAHTDGDQILAAIVAANNVRNYMDTQFLSPAFDKVRSR